MIVRSQFDEQLRELHEHLLKMGSLVEEAVHHAVKSLVIKDGQLANAVVEGDKLINSAEMEIEKKCFTLIALQQPVGSDLRRITTTLKVSTDLERMADHAVSIAETTIKLQNETYAKPLIDIPKMGELVKEMVHEALTAYIDLDHVQASKIAKQDDVIDSYYNKIFAELINLMDKDKSLINQATHLLLVAQFLERIGDYVTNICESIIYLKSGKIVELNN